MATDTKHVRDMDRIILRVPDGVRERLSTEAKARNLSMNALVVEMIEKALDSGEEYTLAVLRAELREASRKMVEYTKNAAEVSAYAAQLDAEIREMEQHLRSRGVDPETVTRSGAIRKLTGN